ncbi:hypothetical protein I6A60_20295 [Frankia sp. AgB1.9]|uniref:ATP/GTP-binding protein n=1 Tax=unclassified Frankia TaxID=2632575 RepID=UPI0019316C98|nr:MULTISPECIES: ATP/GTP-binding protein [unclassified Frankia]MBL7491915.1 hypothetical protein [Frankia sp. AgW1.1]MBL7550204.1 hypothetical protein [Frankia sp. AgB1.9]MBL7619863.1 ATP/GTP-binding protein [Frankia sp. AgB1.8]
MLTRRRVAAVAVALVVTVGIGAAPAQAGGHFDGSANCGNEIHGCDVWASVAGTPEEPVAVPTAAAKAPSSPQVCRAPGAQTPVPCVDPDFGWLGSDGCYYRPATGFTPAAAMVAADVTPGVEGGWYEWTCLGVSTGGGVRWLPNAVADQFIPVTPQILGQRAERRLALPVPQIAMNPVAEQIVGVATWLWIEPGAWAPVSATATAGGVAVSAMARPTSVTWAMGDGAVITCTGPGTPYTPDRDPHSASPDCGHTYHHRSLDEFGGTFPVTVTIRWDVTWAGAGQGGVFPGLATVSTRQVRVIDIPALVTGGS